ncbi:adenylate/guanylate cyclase domain-containing protein [Treponema zioleckii]|uniref:adenylate/guanylate cyclase domain-containing protein n=1 Tax=Treponema zioleckii TaxID=331680 RepID=UPI00168B2093|nr:adenylate/guanylate cyclase domain-containing protein [Treponema zioleckii]
MWSSFGGLTGTTATDIVQTNDGYLNIGTYEGLVRFDGIDFKTIKGRHDNDLKFSSVRAILEDSKKNLWLGSNDEGLQKISPDGNKVYTMQNGLPNNSVRALAEDRDGNIWIGTASGIVYLSPKGQLFTPQFESGTVSKGIIASKLYCDTGGRIWLITASEKGLFVFRDGIFHTLPELEKFGNYFVTAIAQDLQGNFWIGLGNDGILRMRNGNVQQVHTGTILDRVPTSSIYSAPDGTIWFGTERGLAVQSNGNFYEYNGNDLGTSNINKITADREGNIWLATDRFGVGKLNHGKFKVKKFGITANAIAEDLDGRIWVGTDTGVRCFDDYTEIFNGLTEFTLGVRIRHIGVTHDGKILVSCYTKPGQLRYDTKTGGVESWTMDNGLSGNKVRVAIETSPGELYVGTTTGLSVINKAGEVKNFKQIDGLENEYIMCLFKDSNDIVWIGTDGGGIYLMKNQTIISHVTSDDGLSGNVIFKIFQDKDGMYWICTGGGVTVCPPFDSVHERPSGFSSINSDNGIGTDSVFQLIPDGAGTVWFVSNYGISSAKFEDVKETLVGNRENIDVQFYGRNDGLDSDGPTSTALSTLDRHNRIWFPMVDGVAIYDPVKLSENAVTPLVHIESVKIDNIEYNKLDEPIVLKPGTKRVDIKYTGLSYDAPERIQFIHNLTNFEDEYSEPSKGRIVSYTNIKPGKHTFLVKAINANGVESEEASAVLFVQKPHFYQMPLFWIACGIFILGTTIFIVYMKQRAMYLENMRLESMVKLRTSELNEEKNKSDRLLRSILPDKIADELRDDVHSIGEAFEDVTLLFSDIVGFTNTSSQHSASEIVDALNDLFSRFDERASRSGVEKIKTIGDAYMAACGLPAPNKDHAKIMVEFAKGMYEDLANYNATSKIKFNIRIGLNCGPVTAGVIGKTKFIYDVWGDTVNTASRMESACTPGGIRVTKAVHDHLKDSGITFTESILCNIKGKGEMTTYEIVWNKGQA